MNAHSPTKQRFVLGAGYLYYRFKGTVPWEQLSETPTLTLNVTSETVDLMGSDDPQARIIDRGTTVTAINGAFESVNITDEALALFFNGTASVVTRASASAKTERFTAALGKWFQLGDTDATAPVYGWHGVTVSGIEADPDGTPVALVLGTDYLVDSESGMIKLLPDAANVADDDTIEVTFDVAAGEEAVVEAGSGARETVELKYVSANTRGSNNKMELPSVEISPNADYELKSREGYQRIGFNLAVTAPTDVDADFMTIVRNLAA